RALVLDRWTGRAVQRDAHFVRDDVGQCRLAQPRRAAEEHMIERLPAAARGLDEDPQVLLVMGLTDVFLESLGPEQAVVASVVPLLAAAEHALVGGRV